MASVALPVAACGSSSSERVATGSSSSYLPAAASAQPGEALSFSRCIRSRGVSKFPDPTSSGKIPKRSLQQLGVTSSRFQTAQKACIHLLPSGSNGYVPPAQLQSLLSSMVRFSRCIRSHGLPDWPDPTVGLGGSPGFNLVGLHPPIDASSPQFNTKLRECRHSLPSQIGGIHIRQP